MLELKIVYIIKLVFDPMPQGTEYKSYIGWFTIPFTWLELGRPHLSKYSVLDYRTLTLYSLRIQLNLM